MLIHFQARICGLGAIGSSLPAATSAGTFRLFEGSLAKKPGGDISRRPASFGTFGAAARATAAPELLF